MAIRAVAGRSAQNPSASRAWTSSHLTVHSCSAEFHVKSHVRYKLAWPVRGSRQAEAAMLPAGRAFSPSSRGLTPELFCQFTALVNVWPLDPLRERVRTFHYSRWTEPAYLYWSRAFFRFNGWRHPAETGPRGRGLPDLLGRVQGLRSRPSFQRSSRGVRCRFAGAISATRPAGARVRLQPSTCLPRRIRCGIAWRRQLRSCT